VANGLAKMVTLEPHLVLLIMTLDEQIETVQNQIFDLQYADDDDE